MADNHDVLLAQRFLPAHGGAIRWMYEVYQRWPRPVHVITHDYYDHPPLTPSYPHRPQRPPAGDHAAHPNLTIERRNILLENWGIISPVQWPRYLRMTAAVARLLGRHDRLVVHCTHPVPEVISLLPLLLRHRRRLRIVSYIHGEEITACRTSTQLTWLLRRACRPVDLVIANSRNTATMIAPFVDGSKVHIVHPGVNTAEFTGCNEAGARWRVQRGIGADTLIVLTVGRVAGRKNQVGVARAVGELARKYPSLLYCVAGVGPDLERLRQVAGEAGLGDRLVLTGEVDGPTKAALYGACDVFAMPAVQHGSDVEGFGLVFVEAGAAGKPCVAGRAGGQAEAVLDGETGLVVDGQNHAAVTAAIDRLLSDSSLRRRMGDAGRVRAAELDWSRVVQRTWRLVEHL